MVAASALVELATEELELEAIELLDDELTIEDDELATDELELAAEDEDELLEPVYAMGNSGLP